MKGFVIAEQAHVVQVVPPIDITGGVTAQRVDTRLYPHVTVLLGIGVSAAAPTKIVLKACQDKNGTGATAIPFNLYKQETAGAANDVLSGRTSVAAAGYTPSANDGIFYVIEMDTSELPAHFYRSG